MHAQPRPQRRTDVQLMKFAPKKSRSKNDLDRKWEIYMGKQRQTEWMSTKKNTERAKKSSGTFCNVVIDNAWLFHIYLVNLEFVAEARNSAGNSMESEQIKFSVNYEADKTNRINTEIYIYMSRYQCTLYERHELGRKCSVTN